MGLSGTASMRTTKVNEEEDRYMISFNWDGSALGVLYCRGLQFVLNSIISKILRVALVPIPLIFSKILV